MLGRLIIQEFPHPQLCYIKHCMWGEMQGFTKFSKYTSILGARMVTRSKFLTGTTKTGLQGTKFMSLGRSGTQFVHPSVIYLVFFR